MYQFLLRSNIYNQSYDQTKTSRGRYSNEFKDVVTVFIWTGDVVNV